MPFLKQSTSQTVRFGPCLDKTDGVTEETGLTLAQADMRLSKDGGAFAQKSAAGNATHDSDGWYSTTLSTTDTATVGELIFNVHQPANMLPVWMRWWVLEESIYDSLFGASAAGFDSNQRVDVGKVSGTAQTANDNGADINTLISRVTAAVALASVCTEGRLAELDAANMPADIDAIPTTAMRGTDSAATAANLALVDTVVDAIKAVTDLLPDAGALTAIGTDTARLTAVRAAILTDWINGGRLDVILDAIKTQVDKADVFPKNVAKNNFEFFVVDSSDHFTGKTGETVVVQRSIDGGAFADATNTPATEVANGVYKISLSAGDLNGDVITIKCTSANIDTRMITIVTQQ